MRKTVALVATTGALLLGGAGVAHATVQTAPHPSSTTTILAQDNPNDQRSDKTGLWGLLGLLGLGGLMGRKRDESYRGTRSTGTTGTGRV